MSDDHINIAFRVVQTDVRVVYTDVVRASADALVSVEDVHLSMAGGIAAAVRTAAGHVLRADTHKWRLPLSTGSMIVTSGGKLPVKYIFHAIAIEFSPISQIERLIAQLVQRGLAMANVLGVERIAIPLIGVGTLGQSPVQALTLIARSVACGLVVSPTTLREVLLTVYLDKATDHTQAAQKLGDEFAPLRDIAAAWMTTATPINTRLASLRPVLATLHDGDDLRQMIAARIVADQDALLKLFGCPCLGQADADAPEDSAPLDEQRHDRLKRRLTALLQDLADECDAQAEIQQAEKRRLRVLMRQQAQQGNDIPAAVVTDIEDLTRSTFDRETQLQALYKRQEQAQRDLDALEARWAARPSD